MCVLWGWKVITSTSTQTVDPRRDELSRTVVRERRRNVKHTLLPDSQALENPPPFPARTCGDRCVLRRGLPDGDGDGDGECLPLEYAALGLVWMEASTNYRQPINSMRVGLQEAVGAQPVDERFGAKSQTGGTSTSKWHENTAVNWWRLITVQDLVRRQPSLRGTGDATASSLIASARQQARCLVGTKKAPSFGCRTLGLREFWHVNAGIRLKEKWHIAYPCCPRLSAPRVLPAVRRGRRRPGIRNPDSGCPPVREKIVKPLRPSQTT